MRGIRYGSAAVMLVTLLQAGTARAQGTDPAGSLPGGGAVRPPRQGVTAPYPTPQTTTYGVLDEMASRAAVIFVGTVRSVEWLTTDDSSANGAAGIVSIEFAVEEGVRGPSSGSTYVMREWAGLWRDAPRYRVGQRRLMLLHAPGPAGLSSPVDGLDGAIPVVAGEATEQANDAAGTQASAATALLASRADLRWVDAKRLRTVTLVGEPVASPGEQPAQSLMPQARPAPHAISAVRALPITQNPPLREVIGHLRGGEAPHAAAH